MLASYCQWDGQIEYLTPPILTNWFRQQVVVLPLISFSYFQTIFMHDAKNVETPSGMIFSHYLNCAPLWRRKKIYGLQNIPKIYVPREIVPIELTLGEVYKTDAIRAAGVQFRATTTDVVG